MQGKEVPIVGPLPPQRAWARVEEFIRGEDGREREDPTFTPVPILSLIRFPEKFNGERYRGADVTRSLVYSDDLNSTTVGKSPMPYDLPYQLDIFCYHVDDLNFLREAFLRKWRTQVRSIQVDHGPPLNVFKVYAFLEKAQDNSILESEDNERLLRFTYTFTVQGFLAFPAELVKTVRDTRLTGVLTAEDLAKTDPEDEILLHTHSE
jgi:hypothetical protein